MTKPTDTRPAEPKSRRAVIRAGMGLLGATVATAATMRAGHAQAPAAPATQKLAQSAVNYQNHPNNGQLCSICVNFIAPNACAVVAGTINPIGWCVAFAPKA